MSSARTQAVDRQIRLQIRFMKLSTFKRSIVFQEHYSLAVINCCRLVTGGTVVAEVVKIDGAKLPVQAMEDKFYEHLTGRKNDTHAVRMHVSSLMRDGSLSRKRDIVAENDGLIVTHDYFLRERTPELSNVLEVDHALECQFISHCMMQTEVLHPLLKTVDLTKLTLGLRKDSYSQQDEAVREFLRPIYDIHNGAKKSNTGTFNLHLLESNLNLYKGKATKDFIDRQYSTKSGEKGGPIDFEEYYKSSNVVKDGLIDADELAGMTERLILNVEHQYVQHLLNTVPILANKTVNYKRIEALTVTIKQVIDKMIERNKSR